jgi:hypothetical protein
LTIQIRLARCRPTATTEYHDLGGDHHLRRDPDRARHRAIRTVNQLGYTVSLNPIQGAA